MRRALTDVPSEAAAAQANVLYQSPRNTCDVHPQRREKIFIVGALADLANLVLAFLQLRMQNSYTGDLWALLYKQVRVLASFMGATL